MEVSALPPAAAAVETRSVHSDSKERDSTSSSPRQYSTDLSSAILEEDDESEKASEKTESETPNEPVTPVSGRPSQEFHLDTNHELKPFRPTVASAGKPPLALNTAATPPRKPTTEAARPPPTPCPPATADADAAGSAPLARRSTRGSTSSFKRTMSSLFRRSSSQVDKPSFATLADAAYTEPSDDYPKKPPTGVRRWSMNRSSNTTRSNSPPSPSSPVEMAKPNGTSSPPGNPYLDDMFANKKKERASTGLSLRTRAVKFVSGGGGGGSSQNGSRRRSPSRRRASSVDFSKRVAEQQADPNNPIHMDRSFWGMPAEAGTGVKARRMSLSLPDDFTVDVVDLHAEFNYQQKFLGRHGRHIGKGATSKVTLMVRNGCPTELYAVKEFRGKSSRETHEEYEKKVKSEYTLAKSLHHPNIVETIRLCTDDHRRWNHVMEYCSEGDLFTLVNKKYLTKAEREKDRHCLFKQLVQGLNYLHSNGIAHRDVKLENLLITADSKLKITDFGVSEVFSGIHPGLREAGGQCGRNMGEVRLCSPGICGSEPYIAPEVLSKAAPYDPRALDVWSSAIVMIHLIFGGAMWLRAEATPSNANYAALVRGWERWRARNPAADAAISEHNYPKVAAFDQFVKPPALRRLLLQMLNPNADRRISIADVINNRWLKNVECCQLESYEDPIKTIDATKIQSLNRGGQRKIFCHSHLPPKEFNTHSLGKMPGSVGY